MVLTLTKFRKRLFGFFSRLIVKLKIRESLCIDHTRRYIITRSRNHSMYLWMSQLGWLPCWARHRQFHWRNHFPSFPASLERGILKRAQGTQCDISHMDPSRRSWLCLVWKHCHAVWLYVTLETYYVSLLVRPDWEKDAFQHFHTQFSL